MWTLREGAVEVLWRDAGKDVWRSLFKSAEFTPPWIPFYVDASDRLHLIFKGLGRLVPDALGQEDLWHTVVSGDALQWGPAPSSLL